MVAEVRSRHDTEWAAMRAVAELLAWYGRDAAQVGSAGEIDAGWRPGPSTEESAELKRLTRENADCEGRTLF
jgi:transposase